MRQQATPAELARLKAVREMPCIACVLFRVAHQPLQTEAHHCNFDGKAGQKRLGHDYTIPLCKWHHQGRGLPHVDVIAMTAIYGPSLALTSKKFRECFGTDQELLALTNEKLEAA